MKKIIILFSVVFTGSLLSAQDYCHDVLIYAGRNTSLSVKKAFLAKSIYDQYCSGTQIRSGDSFGVDIPLKLGKLGISGNSTAEKVSNLCKTYESEYVDLVETYSYEEIASTEAIQAWAKCGEMAKKGVLIKPTIADKQLLINLQQLRGNEVEINGVRTFGFETCETTIAGTVINVDNQFNYTLKDGNQLQIVCYREEDLTDSNEIFYKRGSVTIGTDEGEFAFVLLDEKFPPLLTTRELNTHIRELEEKIRKLESFTTVNTSSNHMIIGDLQICWGSVKGSTRDEQPHHTASFNFKFPQPFSEIPNITYSLDADANGYTMSVFNYELSEQAYHGNLVTDRTPDRLVPYRMDYIAIGRYK